VPAPLIGPTRRRSAAGVLAALFCAAVLTLSACDTSSEAGGGSGGGSGSGHEGGHPTQHSGTHPTSQHHTTTAPPQPSEYNPRNCPSGLVC
jgi:hypothetical protein